MHIWGLNRTQRVIFKDELPAYEAKGWRDHPNKVGLPIEDPTISEDPVMSDVEPKPSDTAPKKRGRKKKEL